MTDWVNRDSTHLGVDRIFTSPTAFALYDNLFAAFEKAAGAPVLANDYIVAAMILNAQVTQAKIANASVGQAQLKSTTAAQSVVLLVNSSGTITLTGGTYAWYTFGANGMTVVFGAGDTAAGVLGFHNTSGGEQETVFIDQRYIQASPPYRHGPCYVFIWMSAGGQIKGVTVSPDPPWAHHGPTNITPSEWIMVNRVLTPYRRRKLIDGVPIEAAFKDSVIRRRIEQDTATRGEDLVELTPEYKDSDIAVVPHPYLGNPFAPGDVMLLLEPGTRMMQLFADMCDVGQAREAYDIVKNGQLVIDNTDLRVPGAPPGVQTVRASWKLT